MRIVDIVRDLGRLAGYRPRSFWRAMADAFLWAAAVYAVMVLVNLVIDLARLAAGVTDWHAVYRDPNFQVFWILPLLPLLWIGTSRNVNVVLSLLGLAALWALAFWPRKLMNTTLSDNEMIQIACMYLFVWTGNQISYYRQRRNQQRT